MTRGERPLLAAIATYVALAVGISTIGLAVSLLAFEGSLGGFFIALLLGGIYAYGGLGLYRGEEWGWGVGVFGGVLYAVLGPWFHPFMLVEVGLAILVATLLLRRETRRYFGTTRQDPKEEERRRAALRAERTANEGGLRCPHCGATSLWIAPDDSAFCESCKAGAINVRPA